jgi:hypothetical protein
MAVNQEQADKFCQSLKSFYDSLADDEKPVLEALLDQAEGKKDKGKPFFDRYLTVNSGDPDGAFVTLKFPSDNDEPGDQY